MGKILVIGAKGMLGRDLVETLQTSFPTDGIFGWDVEEIDIQEERDTIDRIKRLAPRMIINRTVKAGSITYLFDVKETKDKKPYLLITESRFKGEGEERERKTITIFQEHAGAFLEALQEIAGKLA